jgi:hypothetical protein
MTGQVPRRFFFFPHALQAEASGKRQRPGRVAFDVEADLADCTGVRTQGEVVVMADGFEKNTIGPNQDPCVFSAPLGPVHSFCRIENKRTGYTDHRVKGTDRLLSQVVCAGDVVIYGKFAPPEREAITSVWVDTILVVESTATWATSQRALGATCTSPYCKRRRFTHTDPVRFAAMLGAAASSDLLEFNLCDGATAGAHCCTSISDYRVIVGRVSAEKTAVAELTTSFCLLAERTAGGWRPASVVEADIDGPRWKRISEFLASDVRGEGKVRSGSIAQFPDPGDARELVGALVRKSGTGQGRPGVVAIPPLKPVRGLWRWDPLRKARALLRPGPTTT